MFNLRLKNKLFPSYKKRESSFLRNKLCLLNKEGTKCNFEDLKNKTNNLNLVNPEEIYDFISDKEDIIDLIQKTHALIGEYFPEADLYLKLHDDPESYEPEYDLVTHIVNEDETTWKERFYKLDSDYIKLKSNYPEYISDYSIIIGLRP